MITMDLMGSNILLIGTQMKQVSTQLQLTYPNLSNQTIPRSQQQSRLSLPMQLLTITEDIEETLIMLLHHHHVLLLAMRNLNLVTQARFEIFFQSRWRVFIM